ncbi:LytTR family DNA-binding domain-containing protein [Arcicella sp. LKC2W]|uniref:LytR/AlgR family response regulator transcription factor n=1 Tax=Arcicella sp. LKC2W TaxID=2984198 RepID=UPI002B1EE404|nr:LytTR family DNA-binding domain-containing protein [Arcicella sp. LKC2W]MEA5459997.1 LytTR family DNA-binding domain-containing protein [Arcicella sp. LKC2W]
MENFKIYKDDLLTIDQRKKKVIYINQIIMLKGISNYTCFYLKNGTQRLTSHTLKYYENQLESKGFLRVHRGFIVNQQCIVKHDSYNSQLLLTDGYEVEISRRKRRQFEGSF